MNKEKTNWVYILVLLVLAGVVGGVMFKYLRSGEFDFLLVGLREQGQEEEKEGEETGEEREETEIEVQGTFTNKIVYTTDQDVSREALKNHCQNEGGVFNECGSTCGPEAEICSTVCAFTCEFEDIDLSEWETFENKEYGFKLRYPSGWDTAFDPDDPLAPKFSFYVDRAGVSQNAPFDHFANVDHVSIYPQGIPTEGVMGETEKVSPGLNSNLSDSSRAYVLEDETPFALYLQFEDVSSSWNESGFTWVRLNVENLKEKCMRDGEEISMEECVLLGGDDEIVRTGTVDENIWAEEKAIVRSIKFIPSTREEAEVQLEAPKPQEEISSPLTVKGEAQGSWFFEGSFPVLLTDWDGKIIAESQVEAEKDWTTEEFVPFSGSLEFESPSKEEDPEFMERGTLILQKANPSGLPENDDAFEIPIRFK